MSDLSLDFVPGGGPLSAELAPVVEEATMATGRIADTEKRTVMADKLRQTTEGAWPVVIIRCRSQPAGFVAIKPIGEDALLTIGHILRSYEGDRKEILLALTGLLRERGYKAIHSVFAWPEPEAFIEAAPAAGFVRLDRMDMAREGNESPADPGAPESPGITRWSPGYCEDVARIMCDSYYPEDRIANPLAGTIEGCRKHLRNITAGSYGQFTPAWSFVALREGKPAGYLLTATQPQGDIYIVELAVGREFRGRGIASAMIGSLLRDTAGQGPVRLTVTVSNSGAVRLYERTGFRVTRMISYFILAPYTSPVKSDADL